MVCSKGVRSEIPCRNYAVSWEKISCSVRLLMDSSSSCISSGKMYCPWATLWILSALHSLESIALEMPCAIAIFVSTMPPCSFAMEASSFMQSIRSPHNTNSKILYAISFSKSTQAQNFRNEIKNNFVSKVNLPFLFSRFKKGKSPFKYPGCSSMTRKFSVSAVTEFLLGTPRHKLKFLQSSVKIEGVCCGIFEEWTDIGKWIFSMWVPFAQKMMGYPKGSNPLGSGFPIGASSIPVGTRFCLQSLVCYTFCDRWRRKGAGSGQDWHFSMTAEQGDITDRQSVISPCSCVGCGA